MSVWTAVNIGFGDPGNLPVTCLYLIKISQSGMKKPSRNNKPSNWLTTTVIAIAVACISWLNVNAISHLIRAIKFLHWFTPVA